jgi:hypothetical protein
VNYIVSGALSLIRQILAGQHREGVEIGQAELTLRILGLSVAESREIATSVGMGNTPSVRPDVAVR